MLESHKKYGKKTYDNFEKQLFVKVILEKAEDMINKRRQVIRKKQVKQIK